MWSFQLENSNRWFRTNRTQPSFAVGDTISFVNNEKAVVKPSSIQAADPSAVPPARAPAKRNTTGGGQSRDGYWADKEKRDLEKDKRYQAVDVPRMSFSASQERAVTLVSAALANGALSFGNVAAGKKLDMLLGFVDQVTDRFFLQAMHSHEHVAKLEEQAAREAAAQNAQPAMDDSGYDYEE